jgi:hypothetical protein
VSQKYKEDAALGNWVHTQRALLKPGKIMDPERKAKFNEIAFDFNTNEDRWDFQFKRLRVFKESHGHCELFWAVDSFTFILKTPTNTPLVSLPTLQAMCQSVTALTRNWANGSTSSVQSSKTAQWIRNEKCDSTKYVLTSHLTRGDEGKERVLAGMLSCLHAI